MTMLHNTPLWWNNNYNTSPPSPPANAYVAEDTVTYYVAENGTTYYVQET